MRLYVFWWVDVCTVNTYTDAFKSNYVLTRDHTVRMYLHYVCYTRVHTPALNSDCT